MAIYTKKLPDNGGKYAIKQIIKYKKLPLPIDRGRKNNKSICNQALPTEPKSSIFSLTVAFMASAPGARSLRGSKPLPC